MLSKKRLKAIGVYLLIAILVTAVDFAMSSFSLAHNYTEEEGEFNLKQWKDKYITENNMIDGLIDIYDGDRCTDGHKWIGG